MSKEKFFKPKVDIGRHDSKVSEKKRIDGAIFEVHDWISAVIEVLGPKWDHELKKLRKKGALPREDTIFKRK